MKAIIMICRRRSGVAVGNPKYSRYAGICSNSMSVPTCMRQPRAWAAFSKGVISGVITTSPTHACRFRLRSIFIGSGSFSFMPIGVALTTMSRSAGWSTSVVNSRFG